MKLFKGAREKIEIAKHHFQEHREAYLTGGLAFASGILLARRAVSVTTTVNVVNLPSSDISTEKLFEHHYPLSAARSRAIKDKALTSSTSL